MEKFDFGHTLDISHKQEQTVKYHTQVADLTGGEDLDTMPKQQLLFLGSS
jgi:hypothetical protein